MVRAVVVRLVPLVLSLMGVTTLPAAEETPTKPRSGMAAWDTGQPSNAALTPAALAGDNHWTALPAGQTVEAFHGDAVLSNGRIVAVLRRQDATVEVHALPPGAATPRLRLRLETAAGEPAVRLERVALVENTRAGGCLEATFTTAKGAEVAGKFRLKRGEVSVQAEPGPGAGKLRVECPSRFVVLPDFFADDITLDPRKLPLESVELPSESFVLHLTGDGDALALCVFENRQQDVRVSLAGEGDGRRATGSEIAFEGKKLWVALLEAPRIWHSRDVTPADSGKVVPLDWKMPFRAEWRVDFTRPNDLTDSWDMLLQEKADGEYLKPSWLSTNVQTIESNRSRWNTVLGRFPYPCWSDPEGRGYLQPLRGKVVKFQGPALLYPVSRVKQTPLDAYTVMDVMRNTLGVGPCEHILDLEGQKSEYRGRATCNVRDTITPIYQNHQQKEQRAKVDQTLDEGLAFVKHIRGRISHYVEFGHKMRDYLEEQRKQHPELSEFIDEMEATVGEIDSHFAARADKMKTPDYVAQLNEDFRKQVLGADDAGALERCQAYTKALVEVGGNQDELSGECRLVVRTLRQRAGIRMALDPRVAPIAQEIRARTQEALRNPANHESARH